MNDGDGSDRDHDRVGEEGDVGTDVDDGDGTTGGADVDDGAEAEPAATDADAGIEATPDRTDADDGREWEFSLEDIRQREAEATAAAEAAERRRQPLEAGDPSLEGVVFVLLGVVLALFILSRLVVG